MASCTSSRTKRKVKSKGHTIRVQHILQQFDGSELALLHISGGNGDMLTHQLCYSFMLHNCPANAGPCTHTQLYQTVLELTTWLKQFSCMHLVSCFLWLEWLRIYSSKLLFCCTAVEVLCLQAKKDACLAVLWLLCSLLSASRVPRKAVQIQTQSF